MKYFVVTHQEIPWALPFPHVQVGVDGYVPKPEAGVAASEVISRALDAETALGALRAIPVINHLLGSVPDDEVVFVGGYRLFLGAEINPSGNWLDCSLQFNEVITPEKLNHEWESLIATAIPDGVDMLIPSPRMLPATVMEQYARVHHLDDLLLALGCAIRAGLIDPILVPMLLSNHTMIPYGSFAATKKVRLDFNERLWWCVMKFYKDHYVPRTAYQRRVIDFVFERVQSMVMVQRISREGIVARACRNISVSPDGVYRQNGD